MNLIDIYNYKVHNNEEIKAILESSTIFDKIEFSGISKETIQDKINDLESRQVPERTVLLDMKNSDVAEYWFKNWLHPLLKHAVRRAPTDKRGCSKRVLENDSKQDILHFYENGQQNFTYTLNEVKEWLIK